MKKSFFDSKITLFLFLFLLIAVVFFLYEYFRRTECQDAKMYIVSDNFQTEESIEFRDKTNKARSWEWDFGDGSPTDKRMHTFHIYEKPGKYQVKLTINGTCEHSKYVTIEDKYLVDKSEMAKIIVPEAITVGKPAYFQGLKENGQTWEWGFGENNAIDHITQNAVYTYKTPGEKIITLVVNGRYRSVTRKAIFVHPRNMRSPPPLGLSSYEPEKPVSAFTLPKGPVQKDPLDDMIRYIPVAAKAESKKDSIKTAKMAPKISEDQFEILLGKVTTGSKVKDDFAEYLCDDFDIPVVKNETVLLTFAELCEAIKNKKIKIQSIRLNKNKTNNCIIGLSINYKVKKYLLWVKD